jgi:hypothetical protein
MLAQAMLMHRLVLNGLADKHIRLPTINLVNDNLTSELIAAKLGENDSPEDPVDGTSNQNSDADNAVDIVGHALVDVLAVGRGDEGSDDKVDVAEHEEDGDWQSSLDRGVPVVLGAVEVEMDETTSDKGVDNGERVRNEARMVSDE